MKRQRKPPGSSRRISCQRLQRTARRVRVMKCALDCSGEDDGDLKADGRRLCRPSAFLRRRIGPGGPECLLQVDIVGTVGAVPVRAGNGLAAACHRGRRCSRIPGSFLRRGSGGSACRRRIRRGRLGAHRRRGSGRLLRGSRATVDRPEHSEGRERGECNRQRHESLSHVSHLLVISQCIQAFRRAGAGEIPGSHGGCVLWPNERGCRRA